MTEEFEILSGGHCKIVRHKKTGAKSFVCGKGELTDHDAKIIDEIISKCESDKNEENEND